MIAAAFDRRLLIEDGSHRLSQRSKEACERRHRALSGRIEWHPTQRIETLVGGRIEFGGATRDRAIGNQLGLAFHHDAPVSPAAPHRSGFESRREKSSASDCRAGSHWRPAAAPAPSRVSTDICSGAKLFDHIGRMRGEKRLGGQRPHLVDDALLHMRRKREFRLLHGEDHAPVAASCNQPQHRQDQGVDRARALGVGTAPHSLARRLRGTI